MIAKSAIEELFGLSRKVLDERANVKYSKDDDDYDAGYKDGVRKGLDVAIGMIHARLEELIEEE